MLYSFFIGFNRKVICMFYLPLILIRYMTIGINTKTITPRSVIIQTQSFLSCFVFSCDSTAAVVLELNVTLYVAVVLYERKLKLSNIQKKNLQKMQRERKNTSEIFSINNWQLNFFYIKKNCLPDTGWIIKKTSVANRHTTPIYKKATHCKDVQVFYFHDTLYIC